MKKIKSNHEQLLIDKVIELLKSSPENFTSKIQNGKVMSSLVFNDDRSIIIANRGQILQPIKVDMTKSQLKTVKSLIEPIIYKDSIEVVSNLINYEQNNK